MGGKLKGNTLTCKQLLSLCVITGDFHGHFCMLVCKDGDAAV